MLEDTLKVIFIKGMLEECLDALYLMSSGDIFQLSFYDIKTLCQNYSRDIMRKGRALKSIRIIECNSKGGNGVTKGEITNLLEYFKTNILSTFSNSLDQFKVVKNKEEAKNLLSVYCPKCAKRHAQNECPLNKIRICNFYEDPYEIYDCLHYHKLKIYINLGLVSMRISI